MNRLTRPLLFLCALFAFPVFAANLAGAWQGTLSVNSPNGQVKLRTVIKIAMAPDESLKATFYSIDQNPSPINVTSCTLKGSSLKISITQLNGTYEGTVSPDGNSISGTWSQGGPTIPLDLARATAETAWAIPEPPPPPKPMPAKADPTFAVETIKPSDPGRPGKLFTLRGQDVITMNTTLSDLITMAYDLHAKQVVGLPSWADSDKYDVTGRPDVPGQPSVAQLKIMIQKMVASRFQLKFHRDKKELAAYTINVVKTGSKLTKSTADPNSLPGLFFGGGANGGVNFNVRNATLAEVASVLQGSVLDKPVVDQTGMADKYDFVLKFTPDASQMTGFGPRPPAPAGAAADPDAPPDIFTAFQQQLGLKLESTKAMVDVMVIDAVDKPSAN